MDENGQRDGTSAGATVRPPGPWIFRAEWVPLFAVLAVLMALAVVLFTDTGLDLRLARIFHTPDAPRAFAGQSEQPWAFFRRFASIPVALLAVGAVLALAASYRAKRWRHLNGPSLAVLLALALGPGLVVNAGLKNHWGRPRPCHIQEFGGAWAYQDATDPGKFGKGKSFPCGHSSAGFVVSIFFLLFRRSRPRLAWMLLVLSIVYGSALGLARMVAGAHFASDVLWSALLVFAVNLLVYYFILNLPGRGAVRAEAWTPRVARGPALAWGTLAAVVAVASAFATPYYGDMKESWDLGPESEPACALEFHFPAGDVNLVLDDTYGVDVTGHMEGFGLAGSYLSRGWIAGGDPAEPRLNFWAEPKGRFTDLTLELTVRMPAWQVASLHVEMPGGYLRIVVPDGMPPPPVDIIAPDTKIVLPPSWTGSTVQVRSGPLHGHGSWREAARM